MKVIYMELRYMYITPVDGQSGKVYIIMMLIFQICSIIYQYSIQIFDLM